MIDRGRDTRGRFLAGVNSLGFDVRIKEERARVLQRLAEKGIFRSLSNAAAAVRQSARKLIVKSKEPAAIGAPVHTLKGKAKRPDAILYDVDRQKEEAVVGFAYHAMGESMSGHEHGEKYMGTDFPERPTMGPALSVNLIRFADEFEGSIGE